MAKIKVNGTELNVAATEPEWAERYETALYKLAETEKKHTVKTSTSKFIKDYCDAIMAFFTDLFGEKAAADALGEPNATAYLRCLTAVLTESGRCIDECAAAFGEIQSLAEGKKKKGGKK